MKRRFKMVVLLIAVIIGAATVFRAQDSDSSNAASPAKELWSPDQLDNLVAPIALYPDPLLSQMLVASTYPPEVVEAHQWLQRNSNLQEQALMDAAKEQHWDPSIQALVAVPDALDRLSQDVSWTTDLGNAFLSQQADVMTAVQRMRARAQAEGHLSSTPQQVVRSEDQDGQGVIEIMPANPEVIYVPVYDPLFVWGSPAFGFYPPLYYPDFGFGFGSGFDLGFCFGGWGGWNTWGWGPNWFGRTVFVNSYFFNRYGYHERYLTGYEGRANWRHDPGHRMGIPYASPQVAARFGGNSRTRGNSFSSSAGSGNSGPRAATPPDTRFSGHATQDSRNMSPHGSALQQSRQGPSVVPFGQERQRSYQAPQPHPSAPQVYRAPQVQRSQAPQQFRSAPQFSTPRINGGSGAGGGRGSYQGGNSGVNRDGGGGGRRR